MQASVGAAQEEMRDARALEEALKLGLREGIAVRLVDDRFAGRGDQVAAPDLTVGRVDDPLLRATVPARRRQRAVVSDLIGEIDCDRA